MGHMTLVVTAGPIHQDAPPRKQKFALLTSTKSKNHASPLQNLKFSKHDNVLVSQKSDPLLSQFSDTDWNAVQQSLTTEKIAAATAP